ncbi:MAG TPA: hypothetical protein VLF94_06360, partial [Chlamydiales bacterium]|nr:hypothetical protein [Chlamydiales bacterium]
MCKHDTPPSYSSLSIKKSTTHHHFLYIPKQTPTPLKSNSYKQGVFMKTLIATLLTTTMLSSQEFAEYRERPI